jgi:hypothetical protein
LPRLKFGPLAGLGQCCYYSISFLDASFVIGLAATRALAYELSLALARSPKPEVDLRLLVPPRLGSLVLKRMYCGYCAWAFPLAWSPS